jgi:MerR family mercuric resistance operon transcriptional regulator
VTALRSGQVAAAAGVGMQTLRYYERRGLLPRPERTLGGHRLYPPDTVARLRMIKGAQRAGFTLDEVATLLSPRPVASGSTATRLRRGLRPARPAELAAAKLPDVEARIAELTAVRDTLRATVDAGCVDLAGCAVTPGCPLPLA